MDKIRLKALEERIRFLEKENKDLKEREERLYILTNNISDSLILHRIEENGLPGKYLEVNEAACKVLGYTRDELLKLSPLETNAPETKEQIKNVARELLEKKEHTFETSGLTKDGKKLFFEIQSRVFYLEGKPHVLSVSRDITEKKRAMAAMVEKERMYSLITQNSSDALILIEKGSLSFVSPNYFKLTGYHIDDLRGYSTKDISKHIHPDDVNRIFALIEDGRKQRMRFQKYQFRLKHKKGHYIWIEDYINRKFVNDELIEVIINSRDITEQKELEQKIIQHDRMLSESQKIARIFNWQYDLRKHEFVYTSGIYLMLGLSEKDIDIKNFKDVQALLHPEDKKTGEKLIARAIKNNQKSFKCDIRFVLPNQKIVYATCIAKIHFFQDGKPQMIEGVTQNVTEQYIVAKELMENEAKLKRILDHLPVPVIVTDMEGIIIESNPAFKVLFVRKNVNPQGTDIFSLIAQKDRKVLEASVDEIKNHEQNTDVQLNMINTKGELFPAELIASVFHDNMDRPLGMVYIIRDLTTQKKSLELEKNLEVAKKTSQIKEEFLAKMSHEIRTPMTGIIGILDLINTADLNDENRQYYRLIKDSSEVMINQINDILQFSKIQAGKVKMHYSSFNFYELLENVLGVYEVLGQKPINFKLSYDSNLLVEYQTDKIKLRQVMTNLVSNAYKFTEEGQISIEAKLVEKAEDHHMILIGIRDTGIGIHKDEKPKLFNLYSQLHESFGYNVAGSGLGLVIVRSLVEKLGGTLHFESTPGEGSYFYFTVKALTKPAEKKPDLIFTEDDLKKIRNLRILIVEDKKVNQKVIALILSHLNISWKIVENGLQAVELVQKDSFDVVLMDIMMPIMNGVEATKTIKKAMKKPPIIIGLSANVMEGDKEKYINIGMDDYLSKPVTKNDIIQKLLFWMNKMEK